MRELPPTSFPPVFFSIILSRIWVSMPEKRRKTNQADKGTCKPRTRSKAGAEAWFSALKPMHCGVLLASCSYQVQAESYQHFSAMGSVHEDRLRNLPRPLHHRRSEGTLLDGRVIEGCGTPDLRCGENGRGGHPGASRVDPQGDVGKRRLSNGQDRSGEAERRLEMNEQTRCKPVFEIRQRSECGSNRVQPV